MAEIKIAVINESTDINTLLPNVVAALQVQVSKHFAPAWGVNADLRLAANRTDVASGEWWLVILDDSDQAGALGYHDLTDEGLPLGKVFARTTRMDGGKWTVTASHELLEMLGDPDINLSVLVQDANQSVGRLYAYEVCDACEDDAYGYEVNGIPLSDFVFPSWFETFRPQGSTQFDFGGHINKPLELLKGGYIGYFDITGGSGWQQLTVGRSAYMARPRVGSRRERRRTSREQWQKSEAPLAAIVKREGDYGRSDSQIASFTADAAPVIDVSFEISSMWPAANAAYSIMSDPNPTLPPGFSLVGPIIAKTQNAARVMSASDPRQLRMAQQMMADSNIFGLVAWSAATQTAIVSIRGTQSVLEWIEDVDAIPVPYVAVPGAGLVHMGFQIVYEHIRPEIDALVAKNPAKRILVTGHSLGAAVAVLAAVDIAQNVGLVPELHTFAGPRTGAPDFASYVDKLIPVCHRFVNFMDIVPQVPVPPVYEHVGDETMVHGGFRILDITYAHHLTTYLSGLQNLQSQARAVEPIGARMSSTSRPLGAPAFS
jgi:hypothetical protein